jgi:hypothetical protein
MQSATVEVPVGEFTAIWADRVYHAAMFFGTHLLLYSREPEADREFLRDVLEIRAVDAGEGWLIFALPPAEMGVHPGESQIEHAGTNLAAGTVYLMCRDLHATMEKLKTRGVICAAVQEADWGVVSSIPLPGGSSLGLYQPRHPLAIETPL